MTGVQDTEATDLDQLFHALADPYRRGMVDRLSHGPASVKQLAQPLGMALPSVLKHLYVLEAGGIVVSEKVGRVRTYRIQQQAFSRIEDWVAQRKRNWNHAFDRLDGLIAEFSDDPDQGDPI